MANILKHQPSFMDTTIRTSCLPKHYNCRSCVLNISPNMWSHVTTNKNSIKINKSKIKKKINKMVWSYLPFPEHYMDVGCTDAHTNIIALLTQSRRTNNKDERSIVQII